MSLHLDVLSIKAKSSTSCSPNLLDYEFEVPEMSNVLVGDITYIATKSGYLYLAVEIDLYSERVLDLEMIHRINQDLANDAFQVTLFTRGRSKRVLMHSDTDSQYCIKSYKKYCLYSEQES